MQDDTILFDTSNSDIYPIVFDYIRRWGNHASITLLERHCSFFSLAGIEGIIGYHTEPKCVIVFGDPLCAQEQLPALIQAFHKFCKKQGQRIIYLNASESFARWFCNQRKGAFISAGSELIIDPQRDVKQETGKHAWLLRNKYQKSIGLGISVHEYSGYDPELEKKIQHLSKEWLKNRKGVQAHLFPLDLFCNRTDKRWFYALYQNRVVGLLSINRLEAQQGWYINMLIYSPAAPSMTSEFTVLRALEILRAEKCSFFSLGLVPSACLDRMQGFNPLITWLCQNTFKIIQKIVPLNNKERFWHKFRPRKEPGFLVFESSFIRPQELISLLRSVNIL